MPLPPIVPWIPQTFRVQVTNASDICVTDAIEITLRDGGVEVTRAPLGAGVTDSMLLEPINQKEAYQLSMAFRKASRRFEEIGKGMR